MGLRRLPPVICISPDVARDSDYSHARYSDAQFLARTLGRLAVSRGLGYRCVALAQSVATYRGWLLRAEAAEIELVVALGYRTIRPASRAEPPRPGLAGPLSMSHRRVTSTRNILHNVRHQETRGESRHLFAGFGLRHRHSV
jgi:hypothetical protein